MTAASPYDALLLLSFGGPEAPEEVMPFLERVTRGRGVPRERLTEVAEHYHHFGGRSPINEQNRAFIAAVEADFTAHGLALPIYWGNRNSEPFLVDTLATMRRDGIARAAVFVTSAYSSYSGCRQYREDLATAVAEVASENSPHLDRLRHYFNHPGFVTANADAVLAAFTSLGDRAPLARIVFVTHSIPIAMAETSGPKGDAYVEQHRAVAGALVDEVAERTGLRHDWDLVYCSRSGPARVPWLEPDVNDHLRDLKRQQVEAVVLAPVGFVSDHMEVVFDLDAEALETAREIGLPVVRAATAGTHPAFVAAVRDLLLERAAVERGESVSRAVAGPLPASHDVCPAGCCPNLRGPKPALAGMD